MRSSILLLVLSAAILSGCSSAYKTGQTPDDVYFSPERQHDEYVRVKDDKDDNKYKGDDEYYDDRYLRMKVHNRSMWSDLDDSYFYNPRYSYSSYYNWNNPWSPYTYWNYYYNPYCGHSISGFSSYSRVSTISYNQPRIFNLNTYNNNQLTNNNYTTPKANLANYNQPVRVFNTSNSNNNSNSNAGNMLRNIFGGSNNNSSSSGTRSSSAGSSSSGSSSGSSGSSGSSSAPVRKF
jgi:uncharacterized membrane protein YgcG